jgi:hypothetical protein
VNPPRLRHPRAEAQELAGPDLVAHVLEPSPPAAGVEPFADDPAVPGDDRPSLTPTTAGTVTWDEWARAHPGAADYVTDHWLGAWRRLPPLPDGLTPAREGLHQLAFYVIAPARRNVTRRIGLRWTTGGFGTPFFGEDVQVRVEGPQLVVQTARSVRSDELGTLRRAGRLVGVEPDPADRAAFDAPEMVDPDAPLGIDVGSVVFLDAWYGFNTSVLEQLRVDLADGDPGRVQLWPEHFDVAVDAGAEAHGARASFGGSPGDAAHPEPYLYVAPWRPVDRDEPFWNDHAFNGASLPLRALAAAEHQRAAALAFFHRGAQLSGSGFLSPNAPN